MRPPESSQGMSAVLQIEAWMCGREQCVEKEEKTERKEGRDGWMEKMRGLSVCLCRRVGGRRRGLKGCGVWWGRGRVGKIERKGKGRNKIC